MRFRVDGQKRGRALWKHREQYFCSMREHPHYREKCSVRPQAFSIKTKSKNLFYKGTTRLGGGPPIRDSTQNIYHFADGLLV